VEVFLAYNSGTDAMKDLLLLREYGGHVTRSPGSLRILPNGLPYYFVEVTSKEGTKYVIEAYGEEAVGLRHEASLIKT
jgi:hypothetical protein